jgi:UDP-N-acetylglucosamine 2-epimerase (non-hydrolysing)
MKPVMVVAGTRPEIIKVSLIISSLRKRRIPSVFVHCGQHYDYSMYKQFVEELDLPKPDFELRGKAYTQAEQTARIMTQMERLLKNISPKLVLVQGDTNGVLATSLAAVKIGAPVGHVEAGLRSFDLRMPEEHNRRLTDHVSTLLFAPTLAAKNNLRKENVWGRVHVTGNTVIDAVLHYMPMAEEKSTIEKRVLFDRFALATAHRAENVDDYNVLRNLAEAFAEAPIPIVYPMHPRTRRCARQNGICTLLARSKNVQILPPLGYLDFLILMKRSEMVVTDSGGVQEEATAPCIRKPVLVTRLSTERPEAVHAGFSQVVGVEKQGILKAIETTVQKRILPIASPYGKGDAAQRIVTIIKEELAP